VYAGNIVSRVSSSIVEVGTVWSVVFVLVFLVVFGNSVQLHTLATITIAGTALATDGASSG